MMSTFNNQSIINKSIALYGLGTETERFIAEHGEGLNIVGLLDGYKESGQQFGLPIISLQQAVDARVGQIIVVARPGSCKVIAKRIGEVCRTNKISVIDVRGNDLLEDREAKFDFSGINVYTKQELLDAIDRGDVVSFDLFDTLISRKVFYYTDVFELVRLQLYEKGIDIPNFVSRRISAEKELSVGYAPKLEEIYEKILKDETGVAVTAHDLALLEWETDSSLFVSREGMSAIIDYAKNKGRSVVITTDSYYSKEQLEGALCALKLDNYDEIFVSSEYGRSKANGLFEILKRKYAGKIILHIGDDEYVDVEKASESGVEIYRIYGAKDLYDAVGCLGLDKNIGVYADNAKVGLLLSKLFSNPFLFEGTDNKIKINDAKNIGYFICGPVIMDFMIWMMERSKKESLDNILLCARDGYLVEKIYNLMSDDGKAKYFLTSRISAIRAGVITQNDIDYVHSMKFFGDEKESLKVRFGVDEESEILKQAAKKRENYLKYIESLSLGAGTYGVFDFVAKGTTQLFLKKIIPNHLKGLYFLQLEPEFMSEKGLDIESFYTEAERDKSVIFDNYYILETILTSPMPSVDEFDEDGNPVYAAETRSSANLSCVSQMQEGILEFVDDYLRLVPEGLRVINKQLDEAMLSLVGKLEIIDEKFRELVVEDPFFGRMTKIEDVL